MFVAVFGASSPWFEGGLSWLWAPAFCPDPGGLAMSGDPLCYSLARQPRAAGAHHWLLWEVDESGMAPHGPWVARGEAALMCRSLSPEGPEPQGGRQSSGAVSSSCRISLRVLHACLEHGPPVHLSPVRHTAGEPESAHEHEHAYTCLQPCRGPSLPLTAGRTRCLFM